MSCSRRSYGVTFQKVVFARAGLRFTARQEICLALLSLKGPGL